MHTYTFTAPRPGRLDKTLAALLKDLSRSAVQRLIEQGQVTVNGQTRSASYQVKPNEVLVVSVPEAQPATAQAEDIPLVILYEDDDVIAVNKPAGMVVHPGAGNASGTLANAILAHAPETAGVGDAARPGIVHRLDKETSGIVLLARNETAYRALQAQFKSRVVKKLYLALCVGSVEPPRGIISKPIGRDPAHRQRMAVLIGGREAVTQYAVAEVYTVDKDLQDVAPGGLVKGSRYSFVRARPATGRTHQLRVHFASIGFPIVGDALYGATRHDPLSRALAPRHLLHASELTFQRPASGQEIHLYAPIPEDMRRVLDALGD
ncbi:MAG: RluA family pseudouridine synthase [Chloroflexi bacterium]|nr:RluA family pseudouridine synthase [Chloroflexota bacterium]